MVDTTFEVYIMMPILDGKNERTHQVLSLLARRRLPDLVCHFQDIDFSLDMVSVVMVR